MLRRWALVLGLVVPIVFGLVSRHPGPHAVAYEIPVTPAPGGTAAVDTVPVAAPFTMVGLAWDGPGPDGVAYRYADAHGTWSDWKPLNLDLTHAPDPGTAEAAAARTATEPVYTGAATAVQFRITGRFPDGAAAALVDTTSRTQPFLTRLLDRLPTTTTTAQAAPPRPAIHPRAEWDPNGECPPRREPEEIQVTMAIIHHTGIERDYTAAEVPSLILGYCLYHRNSRGWDDLAYNFMIDRFGGIWEGRAGGVERGIRGGHTKGFSTYSTGIALIGNYMTHAPDSAQQAALIDLLAWKLALHNLDPAGTATVVSKGSAKYPAGVVVTLPVIAGHRDAQATACPGDLCYALLPTFRTATAARWRPLPSDTYGPAVTGHLTGDGTEDGAVWHPADGTWRITDGAGGATTVAYDGTDGTTWDDAVAADLDGDGHDEIVARNGTTVTAFTGDGTLTRRDFGTLPAPGDPPLLVADRNGDGRQEIVTVDPAGNLTVVDDAGLTPGGAVGGDPVFLLAADLDGNGGDEILAVDPAGQITRAGATATPAGTLTPGTGWRWVLAGDFDGDGRDDLAAFHEPTQTWHLWRSDGTRLVAAAAVGRTSTDHWSAAFPADTDRDGTAEILTLDAYTGSWFQVRFDGPLPTMSRLEDAPYRTTIERTAGAGAGFLTFYRQEFAWIRTRVGYRAGGSPDATERLAGADRYATAAAVSARVFPDGADAVLVATGVAFPDALAGGPAAARLAAPILLTDPAQLPAATATEIRRLHPTIVYLLGGDGAVSPAVATQLAALAPQVVRVAGADRYATAAAIADRFFPDPVPTVYLATGVTFPDALAGAAAAGHQAAPVLLVPPDTVPDVVAGTLRRLAPTRVILLGGEAAITPDVAAVVAQITGATVERLAGADRYATAAAVAAATYPDPTRIVVVTTGANFPDAVAGTAAAAHLGAPLLLVRPDGVPAATARELQRLRPDAVLVLGGDAALPEPVRHALAGYGWGARTTRLVTLDRP